MTAMERNSDLVIMQCYAPLLVRVDPGARQWQPDLVGFDSLTAYGSPSYYAFKLFSLHHGDEIISSNLEETTFADIPPLHYSVTRRKNDGTLFVKVVNVSSQPQPVALVLRHAGSLSSTAHAYCLSAADVNQTNSITDPTHLTPVESSVDGVSSNFTYTFSPLSINVLELPGTRLGPVTHRLREFAIRGVPTKPST
jgi:alpha-N-arabinofuranosidase